MHPDFICVGAQKAGTRWLYDQLDSHPDVWMPHIKELRYFVPAGKNVQERAAAKINKKSLNERNREFLARLVAMKDDRSIGNYIHLFEVAGKFKTGDISPIYHSLSPEVVEAIGKALPECRFVFLMRDPIGRLWSQANMMVRAGKAPETALTDLRDFRKLADRGAVQSPSFQSVAIKKWSVWGDRFAVFTLEDLIKDPVGQRRKVFAHLGLDADKCGVEAGYNRKTEEPAKAKLPDSFREFLAGYFEGEYQTLRELGFYTRPALTKVTAAE